MYLDVHDKMRCTLLGRIWGIVSIALMSPYAWQCQNLCWLSLAFYIYWSCGQCLYIFPAPEALFESRCKALLRGRQLKKSFKGTRPWHGICCQEWRRGISSLMKGYCFALLTNQLFLLQKANRMKSKSCQTWCEVVTNRDRWLASWSVSAGVESDSDLPWPLPKNFIAVSIIIEHVDPGTEIW